MAIIKCPNCGQNTTDSMSICYHCGFNIKFSKDAEESKKYYENYSMREQQKIFEEFIAQDDECARFENFKANLRIFQKLVSILWWLDLIVAGLIAVLMFIANGASGEGTMGWGICMIAALALMFIIYFGLGFYMIGLRISKVVPKRTLNEALKLKKWLQTNKNMDIRWSVDELGTGLTDGTFFSNIEIYLGVKLK